MQYIYYFDYGTPSIGEIPVDDNVELTTEKAIEICEFYGFNSSMLSVMITDVKLDIDEHEGIITKSIITK